jgi:hypothetical protein
MMTTIVIALVAGCASALMFASIISGALISLLLFYLAPLPLMVTALGWGPLGATIGGIAAAIGLGAMFGLPYCIAFVLTVALPAWWLGHLALLGRPVGTSTSAGNGAAPAAPVIEWYPIGRIVLWAAGFAALTTIAALFTLGSDAATISAMLQRGLMRIMGLRDAPAADSEHFIHALVAIAPAAAAIIAFMTLTLNLWLAAKVTAMSGRLHRPWPDMKSAALPPMTLAVLCLALALCFTGGLAAMLAQIVSAALMMVYALTGFAVLHTVTLAMKSRVLFLSGAYAVVLVFGWPVLAMVGLGLADAIFGFRQRYLQRRTPPVVPS